MPNDGITVSTGTWHETELARPPPARRLFAASHRNYRQGVPRRRRSTAPCATWSESLGWWICWARLLPVQAGTFCDCGVNIGHRRLISVKKADPARRYIGFEPNPECVAYVEKLISLNQLSNVLIVPVGLASPGSARNLQLYHGTTSDPSASLVVRISRPGETMLRRSSSFRSCRSAGMEEML